MWMDEYEISRMMYFKCYIDDKRIYWENITDSQYAYQYCVYIKNRSEVKKYITDSYDIYNYCKNNLIKKKEIKNV